MAWLLAGAIAACACLRAAPAQGAPGPADLTMAAFTPAVITADGSAHSIATVRLADAQGDPVAGDAAALTARSTDPQMGFGPVLDDGNGVYTVTAVSSRTVHRVLITVTESNTGLTASQPLILAHGVAHSVDITLASSTLTADGLSSTTATVLVSDAYGHRITGDALALSSSRPGVRFGPVVDAGNGVYRAAVHSATSPGSATIRATDLSASPAASGSATLMQVRAPSMLHATIMHWTFFYTRGYMSVRSLVLTGAPARGVVVLACSGRGCPFATRAFATGAAPACPRHPTRPCRLPAGLLLTPRLSGRHLGVGTRLTVTITRPGWIGKYYSFRMRPASTPAVRVSCLAPGARQPGVGC